MYVCVYVYICMYVCTCTIRYAYIYTHTHTPIRAYKCIYITHIQALCYINIDPLVILC